MLAVRVESRDAESVRKRLLALALFDRRFRAVCEKGFVYFPVDENKREKAAEFGEIVRKKLPEKRVDKILRQSHDRIGDIALIETYNLDNIEQIAKSLLKSKGIAAVYVRAGPHKGKFRKKQIRFIAGKKHTATIHCENNVRLKVDIREMYFSPRLSTERARIASMVKHGERVLVMFSGCGPYVCVIARNSNASEIIGVEMNKKAHECGIENLRLNKIENARLYHGDVRAVVPKLGKFDRIVMPLPMTGESYLDTAVRAADKGSVIHFYDFSDEKDIPESTYTKLKEFFRAKATIKLIRCVRCGQIAPRRFRVCADFEVLEFSA